MHAFHYDRGVLHAGEVSLAEVARAAGTPAYVYAADAFRERYRTLDSAFGGIEHRVCFSVKSCASLAILRLMAEEGSWFDVVSGGEIHRLVQAGIDPSRAVYAGVGKTEAEIRYALEQGIFCFNVESEAELAVIDAVARDLGRTAPVALRLNPDVDPKTHRKTTTGKKENKFGLDLDLAGDVVRRLDRMPNVRLLGAHMHLGSPVNTTAPYAEGLEKVLAFARAHESEQAPFEWINAGGGYGLAYRDETVPAFSEYAAVLVPPVTAAGRKLLLEPGRSIAGNSGVLLGTVQYVKSNGEKTFVILDAGMTDLVRPAMYDAFHFLWPVETATPPVRRENGVFAPPEESADLAPADVVGPICESSDVFGTDRPLPRLARGDAVAVFSAGAYGFVMTSQYNGHPRPPEILVDGTEWRVIRERETWADLVRGESA
jgi:diaminopimelate decarboxylase